MNALLDSKLKAYNRKDPILARSKTQQKQLESDKLEQKAKRLILNEKKQKMKAARVENLLPSADDDSESARLIMERERKFKKVAQRGVIKLFNAVLSTQTQTAQEVSKAGFIGGTKKKELLNEISKEKFLDLVQEAGSIGI
ncbi:unnamed protein product [Ambrosiozyma monospora]|uniref:Unnamed protein product n=1 Tax=Ambrosiozyma monospora TaxID=43982 RepID=A0ACB5UAU2_AMBMO|nr:unnamed protein product [Ambrosiozyma monospora]